MKIIRKEILKNQGDSFASAEFAEITSEIEDAISKVVWPTGSSNFSINPKKKGNGVKPIKYECMRYLEKKGWDLETRLKVTEGMKPGPIDATKTMGNEVFAFEWETGNISSSHRALNKIALGMIEGTLTGGVLILPSREMYKYLTDRVGNYKEISPYFPVWKNIQLTEGYLAVIEIEHDFIDEASPLIPKGTDGWAEFASKA